MHKKIPKADKSMPFTNPLDYPTVPTSETICIYVWNNVYLMVSTLPLKVCFYTSLLNPCHITNPMELFDYVIYGTKDIKKFARPVLYYLKGPISTKKNSRDD